MSPRVIAVDGVPPERAQQVAGAIFVALRALVPEEVADIGAVLPEDLRRFWLAAAAT